jgi:hypothetical protein
MPRLPKVSIPAFRTGILPTLNVRGRSFARAGSSPPTTTTAVYAFSCPTLSPEARRLWSIRSWLSLPASVVHSYADAGALGCRATRGSGCAKTAIDGLYCAARTSYPGFYKAQTAFPKAFPTLKAHCSLPPRVGTEERLLQEYLWFLGAANCNALAAALSDFSHP